MRLLFDTTRLTNAGLHTGIQRVVRSLLHATQGMLQGGDIEVWPVRFEGCQWFKLHTLPTHPLQGLPPAPSGRREPMAPGPGDVLLFFDASWYENPWPAVDHALARGARVLGMIHDTLPLDHPEWFRSELPPLFRRHMDQLVQRSDRLFTPSSAVRERLLRHIEAPYAPVIHILPHGSDFLHPDAAGRPATNLPLPAQGDAPYFLALGTLEPRKNHHRILDAFERIWDQGSPQSLVISGRAGWKVDDLLHRLRTHPQRDKRLIITHELSDPELMHAIKQSKGLIYLSSNEGFGLPILEAAALGTPVIASDIPIHRETGGAWPYYIPVNDSRALSDLLLRDNLAPRQEPPQRTWRDVAEKLIQAIQPTNRQTPHAPHSPPGP